MRTRVSPLPCSGKPDHKDHVREGNAQMFDRRRKREPVENSETTGGTAVADRSDADTRVDDTRANDTRTDAARTDETRTDDTRVAAGRGRFGRTGTAAAAGPITREHVTD